ncbi:5-oxoprolinase/urea amidolyase family protein [soil metagenome]
MSLRLVHCLGYCQIPPSFKSRRRFGVPTGGPFDGESATIAQRLANTEDPCFELAFGEADFIADQPARVAVIGAIGSISLNGKSMREAAFDVNPSDTIRVQVGRFGARLYVACGSQTNTHPVALSDPLESLSNQEIRVMPGPQSHMFPQRLNELTVSPTLDRIGIRCEKTDLTHQFELPSEPACVGAIQITPDGTPIILGPDGPTIGGYPKIAVVVESDLNKIGQLRPGQMFRLTY